MRQDGKARERKDAEKSKNARKVRTEFSLGWLAGWLAGLFTLNIIRMYVKNDEYCNSARFLYIMQDNCWILC